MKNICVIGSIGKLGSELMKHPNTVACPWMLVSPPLAMKPRFKGNCSEQWL